MTKQIRLKDEVLIIKDCSSCPLYIDFYCFLVGQDMSEYIVSDENEVLTHIIPDNCRLENADLWRLQK